MKKLSIFTAIFLITLLPCRAEIFLEKIIPETQTKIFIYHIPDDEPEILKNSSENKPLQDIISDDVTADTSVDEFVTEISSDDSAANISLSNEETPDYYPNILKGYAVYEIEEEDTIELDDTKIVQAVRIRQPYNYKGGKYQASKNTRSLNYSKFSNMEYSISPLSSKQEKTIGPFTTGATYNQTIDLAELEQSTGIFTRYDTKHFGLYTAYSKTLNSTNSNYNDNFYISPELKLNQYLTLKEILSTDITRNRKKAEFIISINPFGFKDSDRMRIEVGANATYDDTNALLKNQFKFSTIFKW